MIPNALLGRETSAMAVPLKLFKASFSFKILHSIYLNLGPINY
jgi:hypothetical protein